LPFSFFPFIIWYVREPVSVILNFKLVHRIGQNIALSAFFNVIQIRKPLLEFVKDTCCKYEMHVWKYIQL